MAQVIKLGITDKNATKIIEVNTIEVMAGKGIIGDRHFHDFNDPYNQLSLIESENIDFYNKKFKSNISYIDFRRNIITKNIRLNDLVGKNLSIGSIKLKGIDLCRPCSHLEKNLNKENLIKEFLKKGGLRCSILNSGKINVYDKIIF